MELLKRAREQADLAGKSTLSAHIAAALRMAQPASNPLNAAYRRNAEERKK